MRIGRFASVTGFNGAVASQPRKDLVTGHTACRVVALQWGRGFAATEGGTQYAGVKCKVELQWGRGFAATEGSSSINR